jgi:hypothetical protein
MLGERRISVLIPELRIEDIEDERKVEKGKTENI